MLRGGPGAAPVFLFFARAILQQWYNNIKLIT
jgi:hypothetical protein